LYDFEWTIVGTLACAMLLKMSILKMSSNTEIREKGECAAVRAVGQGLCCATNKKMKQPIKQGILNLVEAPVFLLLS
jgi:hypothetical protein